ncbi:serine/threonine protein kinase [bacterium]|nr:serine/threonine protein kinase [bacterium]
METQRLLPTVLDGFQLEAELGRGGSSIVYRARELATGREVALKLFTGDTDSALERFRREPDALVRAGGHPNVVTFLGARDDGPAPYFVMELVHGESLERRILESAPFPWPDACAIAMKVARALAHLHSWEIVHRDVKPANILMDERSGEPRLLDFGIARDVARVTRMSHTGELVGTPIFMAPEQLRGARDEIGPATDIYGLGAVLYEMLTGVPPVHASTFRELVDAVLKGPPPPELVVPGIPEAVSAICVRALARDPADRYRTAAAFEAALGVALTAPREPIPSHRPRIDLAPYEVQDELGRGGMGIVYRARGPDGRDVAIKVMRSGGRDLLARFDRERRVIAALGEADGFVPLLDSGTAPRGPYLVMPYVEGGSLADRLKRGPLPLEETIALARALAGALAAAHARGIVHRDLKPDNVLFTKGGRPLVADLGLAKHFLRDAAGASGSMTLSKTGSFFGTVGYTAPEQLKDAKAAGPPADVFSLGAILYECLTGRTPVQGDPGEIIEKVLAGTIEPVRRLRPDTPAPLAALVERALEVELGKRFADGAAIEAAVAALAPRPDPASAVRHEPPLRGRALALSFVLLAFAAIAGAALAFELGGGSSPSPTAPRTTQPETASHLPPPKPSPPTPLEAVRALLKTPLTKLTAIYGSHDSKVGAMVMGLAVSRDGKQFLSAGLEDSATLWETASGAAVRSFPVGSQVYGVALSPDGKRAFLASEDRNLRVFDTGTGRLVRTFRCRELARWLAPSPDGRRVLARMDQTTRVIDVEEGREVLALPGIAAPSPDWRLALSGAPDGTLSLLSLEKGDRIRSLHAHDRAIGHVLFSPDGARAASAEEHGEIKLWETASLLGGDDSPRATLHHADIWAAAFSDDGSRFLTGSKDQTLKLWDAATGRELRVLAGHRSWVSAAAFLPSGKQAISGSNDGTIRLWDLEAGSELPRIKGHAGPVTAAAFSPDGKLVVAAGFDGTLRLWDAASTKELATLETSSAPRGASARCLALSPDGKLALTGSAGSLVVWDLEAARRASPAERATLGLDAPASALSFLPDGRRALVGTVAGTVSIWDVSLGAELHRETVHKGEVVWVSPAKTSPPAITAPGSSLAFAGIAGGPLALLNVDDGKVRGHLSSQADGWAGSKDGLRVLALGRVARLWDAETGKETGPLEGPAAFDAAFSPDRTRIVTANVDATVRLWDARARQEFDRIDLSKLPDNPTRVAFSPDGRAILVCTQRGVVLRFELE